jgi:lipopolysaccharide transport system permease protein
VPLLLQLWFFCTPIAYPSTIVPEEWRVVFALNPMVTAVEGFQAALLGSPHLELPAVAVSVSVAVAVLLTGVGFFWRMEDTIADVV